MVQFKKAGCAFCAEVSPSLKSQTKKPQNPIDIVIVRWKEKNKTINVEGHKNASYQNPKKITKQLKTEKTRK